VGYSKKDPHEHTQLISCPIPEHVAKILLDKGTIELTLRTFPHVSATFEFLLSSKGFRSEPVYKLVAQTRIDLQSEVLYVEEWIHYHILLGVEHFYIYDSYGGAFNILEKYTKMGLVTYVPWFFPGLNPYNSQIVAQNHALYYFGKNSAVWMTVHDIDEYVFPVKNDSIIPTLDRNFQEKNDIGALMLRKWDYGSEKNTTNISPTALTFDIYQRRAKEVIFDNREKGILHTQNAIHYSVHSLTLGGPAVYADPSEIFFYHFTARGHPDRTNPELNVVRDTAINERFGQQVKQALSETRQIRL